MLVIHSGRTVERLLLVVTALVLAGGLWLLLGRRFDIDELEHAHAAWSVANGLLPYRDFFEHHTPALYLFFAPLFAAMAPENGAAAALRTLLACRFLMWLMGIATLALTFRLERAWHPRAGRLGGTTAMCLLVTSAQFLNTTIEFRPDVPAVVGICGALACLFEYERDDSPIGWMLGAGAACGLSLLFTQKAAFAVPGLLLVVAKRPRTLAAFAAGALAPVALVAAWFGIHGAFGALVGATVWRNIALTADRGPRLPGLVSSALTNLPLYGLGAAGAVAAARTRPRGARAALLATLASLTVGLVVIGRVYDQYYLLMLPLLAVFGASAILDGPIAFPSTPAARAAAVSAVATLMLTIVLGTRYESYDAQLADMRTVMESVPQHDSVLSGIPGAGTFRPHAWYYFFLVGPFASARDFTDLRVALGTGRIQPRMVIFDERVSAMPPAIVDYLRAHYRPLRGDLCERAE